MTNQFMKRFFSNMNYYSRNLIIRKETYRRFVYGVLNRRQSQLSKADNKLEADASTEAKEVSQVSSRAIMEKKIEELSKCSSANGDMSDNKWRIELAWLTNALEPALQLLRWALPTGNGIVNKTPPSGRSVSEIIASIQHSKIGIADWRLSDLTIGLSLIYLQQASLNPCKDVKGVQISSESLVHDLIYNLELARGCYRGNASALARVSMLRENNILKFVKDSSVMRPGYYIGIDPRKKLIILGIRGTHSVYDLITDIVASSHEEVTFEGYSTHFGTAEAARWFLTHEMGTIRRCLEKYEGFRLRLVGHSLGGATASLLAIMLRKKSSKELGFNPDIVTAVGYATSPCVSRELSDACSDFVTTVVMQDDVIPRLSAASLARLRNEILQTDWMSVIEKEDWKSVVGLVTNAKQLVTSMQDVAHKLADYAKFQSNRDSPNVPIRAEPSTVPVASSLNSKSTMENSIIPEKGGAAYTVPEELFVPGTVYYLKRDTDTNTISSNGRGMDYFTLWKRHPGEHFQRIVLSGNIISDHKCESHYHALRDVIKGLPIENDKDNFR